MRLVARILWVILAFLIACTAAAMVVTLGFALPEVEAAEAMESGHNAVLMVIGFSAVLISGYALIPAMVLIACAEGFRVRSVVAYALVGCAGALVMYYGSGLGGSIGVHRLLDREGEVIAASGIAAGFVYWALAGRRAGAWRNRAAARA